AEEIGTVHLDLRIQTHRRGNPCRDRGDLTRLEHHFARVEGLSGDVGGTDRGATATDGAGVGVEGLLPGEVLYHRGADGLDVLYLQQIGHRAHGTFRSLPWLEEQVGRGGDHVS